jgi:hypothetical protein
VTLLGMTDALVTLMLATLSTINTARHWPCGNFVTTGSVCTENGLHLGKWGACQSQAAPV